MADDKSVRELCQEYIAPVAIGLAVVTISVLIVRRAMRQHADSLEVYKTQLKTIDPARVQQWHHDLRFEELCVEIQSELFCEQIAMLPPFWCSNLTPEQVTAQLRASPLFTRAAANAGIPLAEACQQILSGEIRFAGPSPLQSPPTALWPAFESTLFIGAISGGGFLSAKRTWPQENANP